MPPEDARARIRAQASSDERRAIAHVWIDNCGSADDLAQVSRQVWERWLSADLEGARDEAVAGRRWRRTRAGPPRDGGAWAVA